MASYNYLIKPVRYMLLSGLMLAGSRGFAQEAKQSVEDSLKTQREKYYYQSLQYRELIGYRWSENTVTNQKTGILFVKGEENRESVVVESKKHPGDTSVITRQSYLSDAEQKVGRMIFTFNHNPLDVVGSAEYGGVKIDSVIAHLKEMGKQVSKEIILFSDIHGSSEKFTVVGTNNELGVYHTENNLQLSLDNNAAGNGAYYYGRIGDEMKKDPNLKHKIIYAAHVACEGMSVAEALAKLPSGSKALVLSDVKSSTWGVGYDNSVEQAFLKNKELAVTGESFFISSMLYANSNPNQEEWNNPRVITIHNQKRDRIHIEYNGHDRVLQNRWGQYATIIDPRDDIWRIKEMGISEKEIAKSFARQTQGLLTDKEREEITGVYNNLKDSTELDKLSPHLRDGVFVLCYTYLNDHPKLQQSLLQNEFRHNVIGYDPAADIENGSPKGPVLNGTIKVRL